MPTSTPKTIADAMVTTITALSGAPSLVEWRKTDVLHPDRGDPDSAVIIVGGDENPMWRVFNGCTAYEYTFQVTVYGRAGSTDVTGDDTRPTFLQLCKKALAVTTLSGTAIWDYEMATRREWEGQPFGEGGEVSRFGVLYRTTELTN